MIVLYMEGGVIQGVGCTGNDEKQVELVFVDRDAEGADDVHQIGGEDAVVSRTWPDYMLTNVERVELEQALRGNENTNAGDRYEPTVP